MKCSVGIHIIENPTTANPRGLNKVTLLKVLKMIAECDHVIQLLLNENRSGRAS